MKPWLLLLTIGALASGLAGSGYVLAQGARPGGNVAGSSTATPAPLFADVPPCHWAAKAVAKVAHAGIFVGFPPDPAYLSVNALRQVFEGLRCGDRGWSLRFLTGAPHAFSAAPEPALAGFTLKPSITSLGASTARLTFRLQAVVDEGGGPHTLVRQGSVTVTNTKAGWQIPYAELASLDLPFFPR